MPLCILVSRSSMLRDVVFLSGGSAFVWLRGVLVWQKGAGVICRNGPDHPSVGARRFARLTSNPFFSRLVYELIAKMPTSLGPGVSEASSSHFGIA